MTEWGVVGVIVVLLGLIGAVLTPVIKLTNAITRLETLIKITQEQADKDSKKNSEMHGKIFNRLDEQDDKINSHETRISVMERTATQSS